MVYLVRELIHLNHEFFWGGNRDMRKPIHPILYLIAITLVVFYSQRFLSTLGSSDAKDPGSRAEDAQMAENAYYCLREVAGVQLGHVLIAYRVDEESGTYSAESTRATIATLWAQIENVSGVQQVDSRNAGITVTHRITIRWHKLVTKQNTIYRITFVLLI